LGGDGIERRVTTRKNEPKAREKGFPKDISQKSRPSVKSSEKISTREGQTSARGAQISAGEKNIKDGMSVEGGLGGIGSWEKGVQSGSF